MIVVSKKVRIPDGEITYTFSRSSKPGGQKVNKTSTRVTLVFDVGRSPSLSDVERERVKSQLASRITKEGLLRVVSQKHRTQRGNREATRERFIELMRRALRPNRARKETAVPAEVRERRLEAKKRRGRLKKERSRAYAVDES
jgi:ribosome-associated protein